MDIRTLYEKTNADMDEEVVISVIEKAERGELMYSERMDQFFQGILFDLTKEMQAKVKELKTKGLKVIHILKWHAVYGTEIDYILDDEEEIYNENGTVFCLALCSNPMCEEMGEIGIRYANGGFTRVS